MKKIIEALFAAISVARFEDYDYNNSDITKMTKSGSVYTSVAKVDGQELQLTMTNSGSLRVLNKATGKLIRALYYATPTQDSQVQGRAYMHDECEEADPSGEVAVYIGDLDERYDSVTFLVGIRITDDESLKEAYIQKFEQPLVTNKF